MNNTTHSVELTTSVSLSEACHLCRVDIKFVRELILEDVFELTTTEMMSVDLTRWRMDIDQLALLRRAARLHNDLGINPAGIALVLELLAQRT